MSKYAITAGVQDSPVKTVLYGPEGIGKSTFASHFPDPVFIDTEGGTKRLNVKRLPQPTSWAMLLDEVAEVRKGSIPCGTLVIDTADWAERLAIDAVCAKAKVDGLEGFGYGKGYTYLKEEFGKLLDALEEVLNTGHNVLILAHAAITKFEQPDAAGIQKIFLFADGRLCAIRLVRLVAHCCSSSPFWLIQFHSFFACSTQLSAVFFSTVDSLGIISSMRRVYRLWRSK